jgi:hypothetical protein
MLNSVLLCLCTYYTLRLEHLFHLIPLQRKGLDSTDAPIASAKQITAADSPASVDAVSSGEHKVKKAAALTLASSPHNSALPAQAEFSAGKSAASAANVSSPAAATGSGLSALLNYDDSDD